MSGAPPYASIKDFVESRPKAPTTASQEPGIIEEEEVPISTVALSPEEQQAVWTELRQNGAPSRPRWQAEDSQRQVKERADAARHYNRKQRELVARRVEENANRAKDYMRDREHGMVSEAAPITGSGAGEEDEPHTLSGKSNEDKSITDADGTTEDRLLLASAVDELVMWGASLPTSLQDTVMTDAGLQPPPTILTQETGAPNPSTAQTAASSRPSSATGTN